jgi:L-2-hydroxyglutarate oxidase LhgO
MNTIGNIPATKQDVETAVEKAIDKLALMINEGFQTTASKEDIKELRTEMQAGFDRIEHLLLAEQKREIEDLKQRMKRLEDALAV